MSKNLKLEIEKEPDKSVTASESYNTIYQRENNKLKIEEKTDFNKFKRNIVVFFYDCNSNMDNSNIICFVGTNVLGKRDFKHISNYYPSYNCNG